MNLLTELVLYCIGSVMLYGVVIAGIYLIQGLALSVEWIYYTIGDFIDTYLIDQNAD